MKKVRLGDVATFVNGYAFKPTDWKENGKEIIRIQNLTKSNKDTNFYDGEINEKYKVVKGDILISWSATLGIYIWQRDDAWLNQHIFKVIFDKLNIDKKYFVFVIQYILDDLKSQVHGATMKHITKGKFDNTLIPFPSLIEQKAIAAKLDKAQEVIRYTEEIIANYDALTQSLFLDMFGDPVKNEKRWEKRELNEFGIWKSGGTPLRSIEKYYTGRIPWVSSGELNEIFIHTSKEFITEEAIQNSAAKIIEKGSILLGMYDTAALKSSINTEEITCNQAIAFSKLDDKKVNSLFVYFSIQYGKEFYKSQQRGVRQKNMNLTMIKELEINYPPIALQNQFAERVAIIEAQKQQVQESLAKSQDLFNSLLQESFKN
ncbi:restriction endonuclease subunit S [Myroides phaeus]|uniref:restriction endonuclease subunit S n=1 Tax=Myroides phaeus TaxID=702745 RepID=UPI00130315F2|nr:restriction endonuclease subunit S [Myroides phaeus]